MTGQRITIETLDGTAPAAVFHPDRPAPGAPGVLLYMDALGLRPGLDSMAERLAAAGYVVLIPDLFYRHGGYGPFDPATAMMDAVVRAEIFDMIRDTTQDMTRRDGHAFVDALTNAGAAGPIGVVGYCMGGARALHAAADHPDRIAAAASFHGGQLAADAADSPHLRAAEIRARVYVGVAGVDPSFPPEQSSRLAEALRTGGVDHTLETYVGVSHGWTVPDVKVYDAAGSERHWDRLLTLFGETLSPPADDRIAP